MTRFRTSRTCLNTALFVPVAFGLLSVLLGPDSNWDLRNYHLYNAFAFFNNKLTIDFAPGGFQNFFNPLLDLPYYAGISNLPPRLVAFLLGWIQGLNFILILGICRTALPSLALADIYRIPVLLAMAGCLTVNFLSEIGSTMGDNVTSLFYLSALLIILRVIPKLIANYWRSLPMLSAAGLLMGMGTGLKLTNAIYAVALCAALLTIAVPFSTRLKIAAGFGIAVLAGIALTGGYWFYTMCQTYGNPLFPQFGSWFPNPLALSIGVADTGWLPKSVWQYLLWPFLISADAKLVGQLAVHQIIWAIVYLLLIACAAVGVFRRFGVIARAAVVQATGPEPVQRYVVTVVCIGFVVWVALFSIYRYLVAIEVLTPLFVFILFNRLLPYTHAKRAAKWAIAAATLVVLAGGYKTWGHEGWDTQAFHVDVPLLSDPAHTTVLIAAGDPLSWLTVAFPPTVAFAQIEGNFPKGPGFNGHIKSMLTKRAGPAFVLLQGHHDEAAGRTQKIQNILDDLRLTRSASGCDFLIWATEKFKLKASFAKDPVAGKAIACQLILSAEKARRTAEAANLEEVVKARAALEPFGLKMREQQCSIHAAGIGDSKERYQWCPIWQAPAAIPRQIRVESTGGS